MNDINQFDSVAFKCKHCATEWRSRKPIKPAECPHCRSPYWNGGGGRREDSNDYLNTRLMLQKYSIS